MAQDKEEPTPGDADPVQSRVSRFEWSIQGQAVVLSKVVAGKDDAPGGRPQVEDFLRLLLQTFARQLNPPMCHLWLHQGSEVFALAMMLIGGRVLTPEQVAELHPDHPALKHFSFTLERRTAEGNAAQPWYHHVPDIRQTPRPRHAASQRDAAWYIRQGVRQELSFPLIVGEETVGFLSLCLSEEQGVTHEQVELAFAVIQQSTTALELTRQADADKQAAVASERERAAQERSADQVKTDAASRRLIARLVSYNDLTEFLDTVVQEAMAASGAVSGSVFLYDQDNDKLVQAAHVLRGRVIDLIHHPIVEALRDPAPSTDNVAWENIQRGQNVLWQDYADPQPVCWPAMKAWHGMMGHRFGAAVPMMQGTEAVGLLGVCWDESTATKPDDKQLDTCRVLAQHATLAVRLMRLADDAHAAALARERAQATQLRVEQLEYANAALSRAIEALADQQPPKAFLDATLFAIAGALGIDSVTLWRWPGDGCAYLHRVLEGGAVLSGCFDADPPMFLAEDSWARAVVSGQAPLVQVLRSLERTERRYAPSTSAVVCIAIGLGGRIIGAFTGPMEDARPDPGPDQAALVRSLATQAALALELDRLAEVVRTGAIQEERVRIARELHDSLAQTYTGVILQLETAESALASGDLAKLRPRLAAVSTLARDSLRQIRGAVHALRPALLEGKELASALEDLSKVMFEGSSITVNHRFSAASFPLRSEVEEHLLRITQEALANVLKHARATKVDLILSHDAGRVRLEVRDDGCGLQPSPQRPGSHGGLGFIGIRERVERIGARLSIDNGPEGGTVVVVTLSATGD